jgi:hypothetical protein
VSLCVFRASIIITGVAASIIIIIITSVGRITTTLLAKSCWEVLGTIVSFPDV